jgi:glycosyltransferase involved in cell wall biosynthesis
LVCSRYFSFFSREENQGIALLEGIAYEKMPVIRDHPVFNWLTHDFDCLKGHTPEDFSSLIYKLASNDKIRKRLISNGQTTLKAHDIQRSIRELVALYTELA